MNKQEGFVRGESLGRTKDVMAFGLGLYKLNDDV